jgi:hypothetical protein
VYKNLETVLRVVAAIGAIVVLVGFNAVELLAAYDTGIAKFPRGRPVASHENYFLFVSIVSAKILMIAIGPFLAWLAIAPLLSSDFYRGGNPPSS